MIAVETVEAVEAVEAVKAVKAVKAELPAPAKGSLAPPKYTLPIKLPARPLITLDDPSIELFDNNDGCAMFSDI